MKTRRALTVAATAALALTGIAGATSLTAEQATAASWTLRWNPHPATETASEAFEGLEDDRTDSHPEGQPHIYSTGTAYRFDMHTVDRDGDDRQRNESKGMRTSSSSYWKILEGQTWRIEYQMYIPGSLDATTSFSHIWQLKTPDVGTPVAQLSLPIVSGVPKLQARYWTTDDQVHPIAAVDLAPLQNKWISTTIEFRSSDNGYLRWVVKDGDRTVVDARQDGIDLWFSDAGYNRPKWGIYRSINSAGLQNTYLLVRNLRSYQLTG
jgi:hypothetical protein